MPPRTAVFAYDIHDDRLRRLTLRTLREWRLEGQLSVHECVLGPLEATDVFERLRRELDPATDRLLFAWVQRQRPILALGKGRGASLDTGLLLAA